MANGIPRGACYKEIRKVKRRVALWRTKTTYDERSRNFIGVSHSQNDECDAGNRILNQRCDYRSSDGEEERERDE